MKKVEIAIEIWRDCHPGWGFGFNAPPQAPWPPGLWAGALWRALLSLLPEISSCLKKTFGDFLFFVSSHETLHKRKREKIIHDEWNNPNSCSSAAWWDILLIMASERVASMLRSASAPASLQPFSNITSILNIENKPSFCFFFLFKLNLTSRLVHCLNTSSSPESHDFPGWDWDKDKELVFYRYVVMWLKNRIKMTPRVATELKYVALGRPQVDTVWCVIMTSFQRPIPSPRWWCKRVSCHR